MDGLATPPEPEPQRPPSGGPPPASAFAPRAIFFGALFALSASYLLRPLWSISQDRPDDPKREFSSSFEASHLAKFSIGMAAFRSRFGNHPAADGPSPEEPLHEEIAKNSLKADSPRLVAVHLILVRYLKIERAEPSLRARWETLPEPSAPEETRERELLASLLILDEPLEPEDADWLESRLGFPGMLAKGLALQGAGGKPALAQRLRIEGVSLRYVAKFVFLVVAGGLAVVAGALFLAVFATMGAKKELARGFGPPRISPSLHFETFTLYLAFMAGLQLFFLRFRFSSLPLSVILQVAILAVAFYPLLAGAKLSDLRADLGLTRGRGLLVETACGPLGYIAFLPVMLASVFFVALILVKRLGYDLSSGAHPIVPILAASKGLSWLRIAIIFLAVIMAPLVEEIMFRGCFYRALRARFSAPAAIFVSAILFAAVHPQGIVGIPLLFGIGAMLAALREWRGSLIAPMIAHACVNGVTLIIVSMML